MDKTQFRIRFTSPQISCFINLIVRNGTVLCDVLDELQIASGIDIDTARVFIHGEELLEEEKSLEIETIWERHAVSSGWKDELDIVCVPYN